MRNVDYIKTRFLKMDWAIRHQQAIKTPNLREYPSSTQSAPGLNMPRSMSVCTARPSVRMAFSVSIGRSGVKRCAVCSMAIADASIAARSIPSWWITC